MGRNTTEKSTIQQLFGTSYLMKDANQTFQAFYTDFLSKKNGPHNSAIFLANRPQLLITEDTIFCQLAPYWATGTYDECITQINNKIDIILLDILFFSAQYNCKYVMPNLNYMQYMDNLIVDNNEGLIVCYTKSQYFEDDKFGSFGDRGYMVQDFGICVIDVENVRFKQ